MADSVQGTAFDERQFDAIYPDGVELHYWNLCRNEIIAHAVGKAPEGPVLEIGCGKGLVVADLRKRGFEVTGVDLAPVKPLGQVARHVRTGVDLFDIPSAEFKGIRTVLLLDVIEHLEDPVEFLSRVRHHLPSAETFIYTVPACQELFSNYDEFNRHFRRYDLDMLRRHTDPDRTRGWHASYFFHSLYPAAWLQLRLSGARETRYDVPRSTASRAAHRLLGLFFRLEKSLLPSNWKGTSIIATVSERR